MSVSATECTAGVTRFLRDMPWLTRERVRIYGVALAIVLVGAHLGLLWSLHGGYDGHGHLFGTDYASFWAASRLVLLGQPADVYFPILHQLGELPVLRDGYAAFFYPPTYLLLCAPFAVLPFFPSLIVFLAVTGAAFLSVIWGILRTPWAIIGVLALPAVHLNTISGQNAFLTAAILGGGLKMLNSRPRLAGALLGLMIIKPHLALALPLALIFSRRWRVLSFAAVSAFALMLLSYTVFGWEAWSGFIANAHEARVSLEQGRVGFQKIQSAFALARWLGTEVPAAYAMHSVIALSAVVALFWAQRQRLDDATERALIVIACLLITPFSLFYDMTIAALPLAWMLREWSEHGFPPWSKLVLFLVFVAPLGILLERPVALGLPAMLLFGVFLLRPGLSSAAITWREARVAQVLSEIGASATGCTAGITNFLRDMTWLTRERVRIYGVALAIALMGAMLRLLWSLHGGYDSHGDLFGADYSSFWAASRLALQGQAADVYLPSVHHLAELPVLRRGYEYFFYPPTYLLLCLPLALVPFFPSLVLFLGLTAAAFLATVWRILRTPWAMLGVLALPAAYLNTIAGQNAFLTAAILGSGLSILDRRPRLAGTVLGLMIIKPHLALAVPLALVFSRRWRALSYAALSASAAMALSYIVLGWETWWAFLANAHDARDTLEQGLVGFQKLQSAFALARSLGLGMPAAYAIHAAVAASAVCGLFWAQRRQVDGATERALILIACLLITPFSLFYDMTIAALPLAWMLREWSERGFPPWSRLVVFLVLIAPAMNVFDRPIPFGLPSLVLFGAFLLHLVPSPQRNPATAWREARLA